MSHSSKHTYPLEERLNVITHGFGFVLSIVGLVFLVIRASVLGTATHIVSFSIFGATLILLYAASTLYHNARNTRLRKVFHVIDHAAIYVLIAGTYTPFSLVTLGHANGWMLFFIIWGMALIGIILKVFFTGRFNILSTIMYVAMGWLIIFDIQSLIENLSQPGLMWLFAGGVSYTVGALFYLIEKIKFNHVIFHVFVLGGSFCHYISIFAFVLPGN